MQGFFSFPRRCLSLYDYRSKATKYRKQLTILEKQGKHKSKTYNRFTKKQREHKYNTKGNHQSTKGRTERDTEEI